AIPLTRDAWAGTLSVMANLQETTEQILALAAQHFSVPRAQLKPDDDFFKTLGINSLQALDLLTRVENHFHIELPDYELQGVTDFRTLAERIQARL
ncbi:MAG: acyl carrier protein, partial [Candidatus Acidiferrales bacterium]